MNASYSLQDCYIGNLLLCEVFLQVQSGRGAHPATYSIGGWVGPGPIQWVPNLSRG